MVYRFVYARVGNRPDAEDLTTQVFMRALPRLRLPAAIEEVRSYLIATSRTVLADHWRRHYDVQLAELQEHLTAAPEDHVDPASEEEGIRRANAVLTQLPDNYRRGLGLRFFRCFSLRRTPQTMGGSPPHPQVFPHPPPRPAAGAEGAA